MTAIDRMDSRNLYPLKVIRTTNEYEMALKSMEVVFDEETGPLADYAETLTILIEHYEEENFPVKKGQRVEVLKFLMEQNNLKQKDLIGVIGVKSSVSEILNGKRSMNLQHIRALADRFNVEAATFV
ncbi:MAG: helix-turn-helix domain-containing protein [Deltaproteobacteria bacterium]|nr:helix-turn-helix domain-containing protein [Deltaproteobacteria bacterium]